MMYAVSATDMSKAPNLCAFLFTPHIRRPYRIVQAEKGVIDGKAILLDIDEKIAESLLFVLRKVCARNVVRMFQSKTGNSGWKRM